MALPVAYNTVKLDAGCRIDLMIDGAAVDALAPIHEAQLLTYPRLSGRRLGFNFNVVLLKPKRRFEPILMGQVIERCEPS